MQTVLECQQRRKVYGTGTGATGGCIEASNGVLTVGNIQDVECWSQPMGQVHVAHYVGVRQRGPPQRPVARCWCGGAVRCFVVIYLMILLALRST